MTFDDLIQAIKVIAEIKGLTITQNNEIELECKYNDITIEINYDGELNGELKSYHINEYDEIVIHLCIYNTCEKILELFENDIIWNII